MNKNLNEFINQYTNTKWKFNWRYKSVKEKLLKLKLSLSNIYINNPDPVLRLPQFFIKHA